MKRFSFSVVKNLLLVFVVAVSLSSIALWRTPFSPEKIAAPLYEEGKEVDLKELSQNYYFLGAGRQSFAFVSADGKSVLKFFNRKYFQMPWYSFVLPDQTAELKKRNLRKKYYSESYPLAEKLLREQTGLLYVHSGKTKNLPNVIVQDQANRLFTIDLNRVPFVLQRRGEPIYLKLQKIRETKGDEALLSALDDFLQLLALRISLGIADGDHDVEHNYGFFDEKPFQLDPGRLYLRDLSNEKAISHEWWVGTHSLRKWLKKQYPDLVSQFDNMENNYRPHA